MQRNGRAGRTAPALGAALVVAAAWLPWLDGEDGFTVVNRLLALEPVVDGMAPRWLLLSWYALPLTAAAVWLGTWLLGDLRWMLRAATPVLVSTWAITALSLARSGRGEAVGPVVGGREDVFNQVTWEQQGTCGSYSSSTGDPWGGCVEELVRQDLSPRLFPWPRPRKGSATPTWSPWRRTAAGTSARWAPSPTWPWRPSAAGRTPA